MSEKKKPEAGEYWEKQGVRMLVIGTKKNGMTVGEHECGSIDLFHCQHGWEHLPDCTGWDWEPEVFPQWYISNQRAWAHTAFVVRTSPSTYDCVDHCGKLSHTEMGWTAFNAGLVRDGKWKQVTQEEAKSLLRNATTTESPDDWVTQDRVPVRPWDEFRWTGDRFTNDWLLGGNYSVSNYRHGDKNMAGSIIEVRCRRKNLSPLPEPAIPSGIEAMVCRDIADRQKLGIAKYGKTVADNPLSVREWLEHAYQECLDQAVYLRRAMEELK